MKAHHKYYELAGITLQVNSDYPIADDTFHPKFKLFEVDGPANKSDTVVINHNFQRTALIEHSNLFNNMIFNQNGWKIFKTDTAWIYKSSFLMNNTEQYSITGYFNNDHTKVDIFPKGIDITLYQESHFNSLTLFNTDQMLFAKLLSDRNGMIIHSNGLNINGKGILLAGNSGSGKSTLSGMFKNHGYEILCDDKMLVKNVDGKFWIYGNWCHGSIPLVSNSSVPLKAIFFLKHSNTTVLKKINDPQTAFSHIINSLIKPFVTAEGWEKTLETLESVIKLTPCYELRFNLSDDAVKLIRNLI